MTCGGRCSGSGGFNGYKCGKNVRVALRSSEEWGSEPCWRCKRHDPQREFAVVEATQLLVYVAC